LGINSTSGQQQLDQLRRNHSTAAREVEKPKGTAIKHDFKAETKMLLEIVAKSLYSESEVSATSLK